MKDIVLKEITPNKCKVVDYRCVTEGDIYISSEGNIRRHCVSTITANPFLIVEVIAKQPEIGSKYFYIDNVGELEIGYYCGSSNGHLLRYILGNFFEEEEEAKKMKKALTALFSAKIDG